MTRKLDHRVTSDGGVHLRPWRPGDEAGVDALLDEPADVLWEAQFHALHGPDAEGSRWRRCRVVTDADGTLIGAATVTGNRLHAGRLPCAIEVAPSWRRRGIGSLSLEQMLALREDLSRPLSTKVRPNTAASAFLRRRGGRVYQRCPGIVVQPSDPRVAHWAAAQPQTTCTDLSAVATETLATAFAALYEWTHRDWSPVTDSNELMAASREDITEIDRTLSHGVWVDGHLAALAMAFPNEAGVEVVAETTHPAQPRGEELTAAALAALMTTLARCGDGSRVYLDGHVTDPHLQPVLDRIPRADARPVDLVEID